MRLHKLHAGGHTWTPDHIDALLVFDITQAFDKSLKRRQPNNGKKSTIDGFNNFTNIL